MSDEQTEIMMEQRYLMRQQLKALENLHAVMGNQYQILRDLKVAVWLFYVAFVIFFFKTFL